MKRQEYKKKTQQNQRIVDIEQACLGSGGDNNTGDDKVILSMSTCDCGHLVWLFFLLLLCDVVCLYKFLALQFLPPQLRESIFGLAVDRFGSIAQTTRFYFSFLYSSFSLLLELANIHAQHTKAVHNRSDKFHFCISNLWLVVIEGKCKWNFSLATLMLLTTQPWTSRQYNSEKKK